MKSAKFSLFERKIECAPAYGVEWFGDCSKGAWRCLLADGRALRAIFRKFLFRAYSFSYIFIGIVVVLPESVYNRNLMYSLYPVFCFLSFPEIVCRSIVPEIRITCSFFRQFHVIVM